MRIDAKMSDEHYNSYRKNCPAFSSFLVLRGEHKRAIHRYEALQKSKFFKNKKDLNTFKTYNQFSDYVYGSIRKHPDVEYQVKHFYIYADDNRNSNSEELSARKELYVLRRMKNEVLKDFVKKERAYIYLELSPIEKKKYQALYKELGIKDENKLSADDFSKIQNMSQGIALRQFLAIKKVEHTARYISERIEDDNKIILFTNFIEEYELFKKQFDEKEAIFIDSSFSVTKKQELIDKFNKNESYKVLVGNLIPLGTGHNITSANEVVFNSLSWTAKDLLQGEDRSWRLGQKRDVNVSYMVFDETIELAVLDRVFSKMQNSDVFNEF
jgi:SNF2 family DNA or RNA helicase